MHRISFYKELINIDIIVINIMKISNGLVLLDMEEVLKYKNSI